MCVCIINQLNLAFALEAEFGVHSRAISKLASLVIECY